MTKKRLFKDMAKEFAFLAVERSPASIVITDARGNIEYVNPKFVKLTGYRVNEVIGENPRVLKSGHTKKEEYIKMWKTISSGREWQGEFLNKKKNGELYWETAHISAVKNDSGKITHFVAVKEDITSRKKTELDLLKSNKILKAISEGSQSLVRGLSEEEFLKDICRIITEDCGYAMVWIGYAKNDKEKTVRPVASAGFDEGYLEALNVTWADTERGRGPTGTAVRTGKVSKCENMLTDPKFAPWREEALKRGYASSVSIPLKLKKKVYGAIAIYSKEVNPFTDNEIKLLSELTNDITAGLSAIKLQKKVEHLASFPELNVMPVMEMSLSGDVVYANPTALKSFPNIVKLGIKHSIFSGFKLDTIPRDGVPITFEAKSNNRWYDVSAKFMSQFGNIRIYSAEITRRVEALNDLAKEKNLLRVILENTNTHIAYFDRNFRFLMVNDLFRKTMSSPEENLIGKTYFEVFHGRDTLKILKQVRDTGQAMEFKARPSSLKMSNNNRVAYWDWKVTPIKDEQGRVTNLLSSGIEVTDRIREEENQRNFITILGHELRNPLASIVLALDLVALQKNNTKDIQEELDVIGHQTNNMNKMIKDLLDISRLGRGRLELEIKETDLMRIVYNALSSIRPIAEKNHRHIKVSSHTEQLKIHADRLRIEQIILNLLSNAIKYTKDDSLIEISIGQKRGEAFVSVRDNGLGIARNKISGIFELFSQSDQGTQIRKNEGLGVGLYMAREIARLHGGDVTVCSRGKGKGSEFTLKLPIERKDTKSENILEQEKTQESGTDETTKKIRVLSVDDNIELAKFITKSLGTLGYETGIAYGGKEALKVIRTFKPDFVLLDIGMPDMDGLELARRIKKDKKMSGIRLIAVSGFGLESDKIKAKEAGFESYMVKPVRIDDLDRILSGERRKFKI